MFFGKEKNEENTYKNEKHEKMMEKWGKTKEINETIEENIHRKNMEKMYEKKQNNWKNWRKHVQKWKHKKEKMNSMVSKSLFFSLNKNKFKLKEIL